MKKKQQEELQKKELLQSLKGKENVTLDGQKIMLYANIGNIRGALTRAGIAIVLAKIAVWEFKEPWTVTKESTISLSNCTVSEGKGQEVNAEYAVATTGDNFSQMFAAMEDDYMSSFF